MLVTLYDYEDLVAETLDSILASTESTMQSAANANSNHAGKAGASATTRGSHRPRSRVQTLPADRHARTDPSSPLVRCPGR